MLCDQHSGDLTKLLDCIQKNLDFPQNEMTALSQMSDDGIHAYLYNFILGEINKIIIGHKELRKSLSKEQLEMFDLYTETFHMLKGVRFLCLQCKINSFERPF